MRNTVSAVLIFAVSVLLVSCIPSELSKQPVTALSLIQAEVGIYQSLDDKKENELNVVLYDSARREIMNDSLRLFVNGKELEYILKKGWYYSKSGYYYASNVNIDEGIYQVDILLTNGKRYHLAKVGAFRESTEKDIVFEKPIGADQDLVIAWKNLADVSLLNITRSMRLNHNPDSNITTFTPTSQDTLRIAGSGRYVIPRDSLKTARETAEGVSLEFIAQRQGKVNVNLMKGSSIYITGKLEKSIDFH